MKSVALKLHIALLLLPAHIFAQSSDRVSVSSSLKNPLRSEIGTINDLFVALLNIVIVIAIPIIVFFIILAGFKYVTAQGNATKVEEATRALTYAIIGGVLILGAVVLIEIISNVVNEFTA